MPTPQAKPQAAPDFIPVSADTPDFIPAGNEPQAAPPDDRNGFQKMADDLTKVEPMNTRPGIGGHLLTAAGNMGGGVLSPLSLLAHPIQTAKMAVNSINQGMSPVPMRVFQDVPSMQEGLARGMAEDPAGTLENAAGAMLGGEAGGELLHPVLGAVGRGMKAAAPRVADVAMGTLPDTYGGDPGMAVAREGISGFSPQSVLAKTKNAIPKMAAEHSAVLAKPLLRGIPQPSIDIGEAVSSPFDAIRTAKTDPMTGATAPVQMAKLNRMQTLLTHEPDSFTGQPTTGLRPLNQFSPIDANTLKSNIYGMTDYESPFKSTLANDALKQAAHGIKGKIEEAVPESIESGERLHNLMALKDLMERKGPLGIPASKDALIGNVLRKAGTTAAGGLFRLGDAAPAAANIYPGLTALGALNRRRPE